MQVVIKLLIFGILALGLASGANILGIWFHAGKSHHILGEVLLKELARRGHNVTMASPFPLKEKFPNYTDIHLTGIQEDQDAREAIFLKMNEGGFRSALDATIPLVRAQTELTLTHPEMSKLLRSGVKFDVIIIDWFMNQAILYFGKLFNAPVIPLASHGTTSMSNGIVGNPSPPSYLPLSMIDFPVEMSFVQRMANGLITVFGAVLGQSNINFHQDLIKKHFNDTMTYEEMQKKVALVFSNGHYSYEHPRPFVPSLVPIGGFHVTKPKKLPKHFQEFMDGSESGVIFFSLGSNMKSVLLPDKTQQEILKVLSKLPYRVIWKWEDENLKGKPSNVLISKWCPQNDILAHPKLKLFISHGGLLSTIEALHHGVPVLGIPIFGDQKTNVPNAVRNGYAVQLDLKDLNERTFSEALDEILKNPKYRDMAKKRSLLLRDQPIPPMDAAVFWVEHVIRHKGGDHLRNYGANLPWYQYLMIDVILFLLVCALSVLFVICVIFIVLFKLIKRIPFRQCKEKNKVKKNKLSQTKLLLFVIRFMRKCEEMRFLILSLLFLNETFGANILGIWFHAGKSHHILGEVLLKELARRGHNITMASPFPLKEPFPNYTDIYLSGIREDQESREEIFLKMNKGGPMVAYETTIALTRAQTELTLAHPEMKKLLESGTKFDVIIMDWFLNGAVLYFGKLFKAPVILSASSGTTILTTDISGNPYPPSYVPMSNFPVEMTFLQRVVNGIIATIFQILNKTGTFHEDLVKKYYNDTFTSSDMKDVVALMLSNAHYAYEYTRPYVPNVIPVGGFHVLPPRKLPQHLQEFMDNAEQGVIYFSLGSNMKSTLLPEKTKRDILRVFSKMPYRVIWKWEDDRLEVKLKNVMLVKWCPQNDILAHPKLKLFISHGGLLSTIEAIHYGIPVLGIPIFGDQELNVPIAVRNGYALQLKLDALNEVTFSQALNELLSNPKYKKEAEKRSLLLRDRPLSAMDTAVFWVEHVIRHKGGEHLKTYGLKQPLYQYLMLDVILFVTSLIFLTSLILYFIVKKLICFIRKMVISRSHTHSKKIQ
ncbi:uncharacterized protein LOC123307146 [Coccinella septempunctata]|uniref:uncharacterized protein LOC123307146 n=1 Tax=Coccinella septempunctata TaxID=41139 RepID=UPI001D0746EB|nr:uncharacterized protein LOC123307146 [Coccinella septempunctata]